MKILFLSRLFYPHVGGVEKHVENLSAELINKNHKITLITSQHAKNLPKKEKYKGIQIYRIPNKAVDSKTATWSWIKNHKQLFDAVNIVHVHDVYWWILPIRFGLKAPTFTTFHGYEGSNPPRIQAIIHRKLVEKMSQKTICIGAFMKKWYHANPDMILYGAAQNQAKTSKKLKLDSAIFVGRVSLDTGILDYTKAIKILKDQGIDLNLDIYGDGPQMHKIKQFAQKNPQLSIQLKGFTQNASAKIPDYAFAFVSRYLAILESMQAKRSVYAHYNNQIKKDYLQCHPQIDNMYIFKNPKHLAEQIRLDIKKTSTKQEKINKASTWAKHQTWEKLARDYLSLWS
jgi:glycosyltransferase involved in cell wall biosynthesis